MIFQRHVLVTASDNFWWIYQSSWITWPIRMWLRWGIVLCKESLCKTWIVFILITCICFIIKMNHVWSRVKNIAFKKTTLFFPKTHCFPTCALVYPIVLKRKIITGYRLVTVNRNLGTWAYNFTSNVNIIFFWLMYHLILTVLLLQSIGHFSVPAVFLKPSSSPCGGQLYVQ